MFTRLPESNAKRQRRATGFVVSTVLHLVVIAFAVQASGLKAAPTPKTERVTVIYKAPPDAPPPPAAPTTRRNSGSTEIAGIPVPPALPSVISPDISTTLPEPDAMRGLIQNAFDGRPETLAGPRDGPPNVADGAALPESLVEKAVVAIPGTATPRYPSMLQSAGVEGDVRGQFVVDTLGRVEQGSFKAVLSTHDLFTSAVRDALARARFKPAEAGGRRVRQLVEQTFTFRITR